MNTIRNWLNSYGYQFITDHRVWNQHLQDLTKQLPPSQSRLRLLDVGCGPGNSIREFVKRRPDIDAIGLDSLMNMLTIAHHTYPQRLWVLGDAEHLPFADNSFDVVTANSLMYLLPNPQAFLTEAWRVLRPGGRLVLLNPAQGIVPLNAWRWLRPDVRVSISFFMWHMVGILHRRDTTETLLTSLQDAGFVRILTETTLKGWGIIGRGEKPYPPAMNPRQRISLNTETNTGKTDLSTLPSRYVHLLIRQTPNKPAWALSPDEHITWSALRLGWEGQTPTVLAFSSLPKAVEFMQVAILADKVHDVNKIAKFNHTTALKWPFPLMLNPSSETLTSAQTLSVDWQAIDPTSAEMSDE
jgi:SAM-dependent methyltransferase